MGHHFDGGGRAKAVPFRECVCGHSRMLHGDHIQKMGELPCGECDCRIYDPIEARRERGETPGIFASREEKIYEQQLEIDRLKHKIDQLEDLKGD